MLMCYDISCIDISLWTYSFPLHSKISKSGWQEMLTKVECANGEVLRGNVKRNNVMKSWNNKGKCSIAEKCSEGNISIRKTPMGKHAQEKNIHGGKFVLEGKCLTLHERTWAALVCHYVFCSGRGTYSRLVMSMLEVALEFLWAAFPAPIPPNGDQFVPQFVLYIAVVHANQCYWSVFIMCFILARFIIFFHL